MCGIAGFLGRPATGTPLDALRPMTDAIAHRGPDADGHWCDDEAGIALGHRRLSIIDLSPEGTQPMVSASGRYVLVFNGEAYNYAPLRAQLAAGGYPFRGHSDTEVLLAAFERWGVREAIPRFAGMFAMAVWDRETRTLTLVRDRLGEKPLYYGRMAGAWLFGSELKALRRFPGWHATTSPRAVAQLLRHGYIQAPLSIHAEIGKVRPGTMVELAAGREPVEHVYWSALDAAQRGLADPIEGSDDEIADALGDVLRPIVRDEMVADVPLGAFLSGGIDSSLIVALMQAENARPVKTFTIGFDDPRFDESKVAAAVARHLGTEHTELTATGADALDLVPSLTQIYDEPMADSSQLPTLLVSCLTRQHVTVALSGDGGDELFGGYIQHRQRGSIARLRSLVPSPLRGVVGATLKAVPFPGPSWLSTAADRLAKRPLSSVTRLGAMLAADDEREVYLALMAQTATPDRLTGPRVGRVHTQATLAGPWLDDVDPLMARMLFDTVTYLPDDILVKVDRAAMAYSLETRAPLLDHRVFEFAWRVRFPAKVIDGTGKRPLRRLLARYVPSALVDRPKQGFAVPLAHWLRGPLREWAEDLLHAAVIRENETLDAGAVQALWSQHIDETADHATLLWSLLALCGHLLNEDGSPQATATR